MPPTTKVVTLYICCTYANLTCKTILNKLDTSWPPVSLTTPDYQTLQLVFTSSDNDLRYKINQKD